MAKNYWVVRVEEPEVEAINALRVSAKILTGAEVSFAAMTRSVLKEGIKKLVTKSKRK